MTPSSSVPVIEQVSRLGEGELRSIVSELYGMHHVLRSMGIVAESIFVMVALVSNSKPPGHHVCVVVRKAEREVVFRLQRVQAEHAGQIHQAWLSFIERELQQVSESVLGAMVDGSESRRRAAEIARSLALRGLLEHLDPNVH